MAVAVAAGVPVLFGDPFEVEVEVAVAVAVAVIIAVQ